MHLIKRNINKGLFLIASLSIGSIANAQYLEEFPSECAYASQFEALPGHVLRLGFVAWTRQGWSFFFPDSRITRNLQRVFIADNVGLIGQNPEEDLGGIIRARTPNGSFVVAQIFVADNNIEPLVTCMSRPIMLDRYNPYKYGNEFSWLDRASLGRWLGVRKFSSWKWKQWWRRDFDNIRRNFKGFKDGDHRRRRDRDHRDRFLDRKDDRRRDFGRDRDDRKDDRRRDFRRDRDDRKDDRQRDFGKDRDDRKDDRQRDFGRDRDDRKDDRQRDFGRDRDDQKGDRRDWRRDSGSEVRRGRLDDRKGMQQSQKIGDAIARPPIMKPAGEQPKMQLTRNLADDDKGKTSGAMRDRIGRGFRHQQPDDDDDQPQKKRPDMRR